MSRQGYSMSGTSPLANNRVGIAAPGDHADMFCGEPLGCSDGAVLALLVGRPEAREQLAVLAAVKGDDNDQFRVLLAIRHVGNPGSVEYRRTRLRHGATMSTDPYHSIAN